MKDFGKNKKKQRNLNEGNRKASTGEEETDEGRKVEDTTTNIMKRETMGNKKMKRA